MNRQQMVETILDSTDSDSDYDYEKGLVQHINNRVKLMTTMFKVVTSKKIARMAPECVKGIPLSELKIMLFDVLMGISNKRLEAIILDKEKPAGSSSSESEQRPTTSGQDLGVISLDDITDDSATEVVGDDSVEMEILLSEHERMELEFGSKRKHKKSKHLKHAKRKHSKIRIKKEVIEEDIKIKQEVVDSTEVVPELPKPEEPVMSALNLLELQARARAIRSQLKNEIEKVEDTIEKPEATVEVSTAAVSLEPEPISGSPNSVVFLSPARDVVNVSSHTDESDNENKSKETVKERAKKSEQTTESQVTSSTKIDETSKPVKSASAEDEDNDVLIMNVTQEYEDFDREIENVPMKKEAE